MDPRLEDVDIEGFRIGIRLTHRPSNGDWVAAIGPVTVVAGNQVYVDAREILAWGQAMVAEGATAEEALAVMERELRQRLARLTSERRSERLTEAQADHEEEMRVRRQNPPWGNR